MADWVRPLPWPKPGKRCGTNSPAARTSIYTSNSKVSPTKYPEPDASNNLHLITDTTPVETLLARLDRLPPDTFKVRWLLELSRYYWYSAACLRRSACSPPAGIGRAIRQSKADMGCPQQVRSNGTTTSTPKRSNSSSVAIPTFG
jgi:hypothetical protein